MSPMYAYVFSRLNLTHV